MSGIIDSHIIVELRAPVTGNWHSGTGPHHNFSPLPCELVRKLFGSTALGNKSLHVLGGDGIHADFVGKKPALDVAWGCIRTWYVFNIYVFPLPSYFAEFLSVSQSPCVKYPAHLHVGIHLRLSHKCASSQSLEVPYVSYLKWDWL